MGVNADKINQCQTDESIKKIVNDSEIINADGASVVLASRFLGYQSSWESRWDWLDAKIAPVG